MIITIIMSDTQFHTHAHTGGVLLHGKRGRAPVWNAVLRGNLLICRSCFLDTWYGMVLFGGCSFEPHGHARDLLDQR